MVNSLKWHNLESSKWSKHNSTMNIVYLEILFSTDPFHAKNSQLVCFANHLIGFYGLQSPQIFPKVDLLPIHNDSEKQKVARKT